MARSPEMLSSLSNATPSRPLQADARMQLEGLKLSALLKEAHFAGIDEDVIGNALDAPDARKALISLILPPDQESAPSHLAKFDEDTVILESKMSVQTLLKQACQDGTLAHALESVLTPEKIAARPTASDTSTYASARSHGEVLDERPVNAEAQTISLQNGPAKLNSLLMDLQRQLHCTQQQNAGFQESLQELDSMLEATRMGPASRADVEELQKALEELHADFAFREKEIARLKQSVAAQEDHQVRFQR